VNARIEEFHLEGSVYEWLLIHMDLRGKKEGANLVRCWFYVIN
jgi:hypothetical protein